MLHYPLLKLNAKNQCQEPVHLVLNHCLAHYLLLTEQNLAICTTLCILQYKYNTKSSKYSNVPLRPYIYTLLFVTLNRDVCERTKRSESWRNSTSTARAEGWLAQMRIL